MESYKLGATKHRTPAPGLGSGEESSGSVAVRLGAGGMGVPRGAGRAGGREHWERENHSMLPRGLEVPGEAQAVGRGGWAARERDGTGEVTQGQSLRAWGPCSGGRWSP